MHFLQGEITNNKQYKINHKNNRKKEAIYKLHIFHIYKHVYTHCKGKVVLSMIYATANNICYMNIIFERSIR